MFDDISFTALLLELNFIIWISLLLAKLAN